MGMVAGGTGQRTGGFSAERTTDSWETLFAEAGILMAAATFSSAAIHTALRIWSAAPASFFCFAADDDRDARKYYGESESRSVYSAEIHLSAGAGDWDRARRTSHAAGSGGEHSRGDSAHAQGMADARAARLGCGAGRFGAPRTRFANLLPAERRASHDRMHYLLPASLGSLMVLG